MCSTGWPQKKGAGSDAILEAYLTTGDDAFGAPFASTSAGTWTTQATNLRLGATTAVVVNATVDNIRLDSGSLPPAGYAPHNKGGLHRDVVSELGARPKWGSKAAGWGGKRFSPPTAPLSYTSPPTGQIWKVYYYAGAQMVAMRELSGTTGNTLYYLHGDHLGSTSTTTCGNSACGTVGAVLTRQSYYPYGGVRVVGNLPTDHTYTGQIEDDSTGLYFYNARYYSGSLGRFISADTIVPGANDPQAYNRYAYTRNNPINRTDPSGHCDGVPGGLSCMDAYDTVWNLKNAALAVNRSVSEGTIEPVEGLAKIADTANALYPKDPDGFMAAMTNVLVGVDPRTTTVSGSVLDGANPNDNPYFAGYDLLPHNAPLGTHHVEIGDWSPQYFDGTSNQGYHFGGLAAIAYYEGFGVSAAANFLHDPASIDNFMITWQEKHIENYAGSDVPILNTWANNFTDVEVSQQDYDLGIASIKFAFMMKWMSRPFHSQHDNPGNWIRENLKAE